MYSISRDNLLLRDNKSIRQMTSPHTSGGKNICDFVVIHYTGSAASAESSNQWAINPDSDVSWHITIDRDGRLTQLADFRTITWHAGRSEWEVESSDGDLVRQYENMNRYSIGIELANAGKLKKEDDNYLSSVDTIIPTDKVLIDTNGIPWESYTLIQLETVKAISLTLCKKYKCVDVLGHSQISPSRKIDPGPLFPMDELRSDLRKFEWFKHNKIF